jgi:hypothetical protein
MSTLSSHPQEELPAVAESCAGAARGVAAAYAEVEAGRAADHPKLAELRSSLLGFRALHPVRSHVAHSASTAWLLYRALD